MSYEKEQEHELCLCNSAWSLIKDYGYSMKKVFETIKKKIEEKSKDLPPIPVLYNGCYGGYALSEAFLSFVNEKSPQVFHNMCRMSDNECRILYGEHIIPYGKYIENKYPIVYDMIRILHTSNISNIITHMEMLVHKMKSYDTIDFNMKRLNDYLENPLPIKPIDTSSKPGKYILLTLIDPQLYRYDLEALRTFKESIDLDNIKSECLLAIDTLRSSDILTYVPDSIQTFIENFLKALRPSDISIGSKMEFMKAVDLYGEIDPAIWDHQNYGESKTFKFLTHAINHAPDVYNFFSSVHTESDKEEDIYQKVGLLCASGPYASLEIAYIPPYMPWNISEYDGIESIIM